jgi:Tol biopolymer transport system component
VKTRTRRGVAALGTAAALAAGGMATAPESVAATGGWAATDGKIVTAGGNWLYSSSASGGQPSDFLKPDGGAESPAWSPDGSRLVFAASGGALYTVSSAGTYLAKLPGATTVTTAEDPTYWNVGADVAYGDASTYRLYYEPSDGSLPAAQLLPAGDKGCDSQPSGGVGAQLVFVRGGAWCSGATTPTLRLYDAGTGKDTLITSNGVDPALSPDGTTVAFSRQVNGVYQLFTIGVDGTGLRQLTSGTQDLRTRPGRAPAPGSRTTTSPRTRWTSSR